MSNLKVSIFTPSHNTKYLDETYESIKRQEFYEWVILLNNNAQYNNTDPRVRIVHTTDKTGFVGALKRKCCELCTGDILLELDHDDILTEDAIEEVKKAFNDNPDVGFVYSHTCNFKGDFETVDRFGDGFGWRYEPFQYKNYNLESFVSFPPNPESCSRIWFQPNHLRAWLKEVYWQAGGHDVNMRVLDDQDLICRTYIVTKFHLISKCLYLYRIDGNNTWLIHNQEIQENVYPIYDKYIEKMILKSDGLKINLGGRFHRQSDYQSVDLKDADIICDLNDLWPFEDNSVSVIRADDVLEHLKDPIHTMKEAYRVLKPYGWMIGQVPSTDGRGAFQDPTHKSFFNENSFYYYTDTRWAQYIDTPVRFQAVRLYTTPMDGNQICWVKFHLLKLIDNENYRPPGLIFI